MSSSCFNTIKLENKAYNESFSLEAYICVMEPECSKFQRLQFTSDLSSDWCPILKYRKLYRNSAFNHPNHSSRPQCISWLYLCVTINQHISIYLFRYFSYFTYSIVLEILLLAAHPNTFLGGWFYSMIFKK